MRSARSALLVGVAVLASGAAAQKNWVANGDFSQGLTGWTGSGAGDQPTVERFDVTGLGPSMGFGVNAGPKLNSTRKPPYVLAQNVVLVRTTYELYIDLAREAPGFNNDAGTVKVRVGGVEIASRPWGSVASGGVARDVLCVRFQPNTGGNQKLEILFDRTFASLRGRTPRLWIDNVGLWLTDGPTFCFRGDRRPGQQVTLAVSGSPNSAFVVFVAAAEIGGFTVPGFSGTWRLDLATALPFLSGALDNKGGFALQLTLPTNLTGLQGVSLFFQPVGLASSRNAIGIHHDYGLQR